MKRIFAFVAIIASSLMLTSCFEVAQKVDLKRNGSGTYTFSLDLSRFAGMANAEKSTDEDLFKADKIGMREKLEELNGVSGISDAKVWADNEAYTINLSFEFEDVDALNHGAQVMFSDSGKVITQDIFSFDRGGFHFHGYDFMSDGIKEKVGDRNDSLQEMMFAMLADVNFSTEVHFGETVDRVDNENVLLKGDRRGVVLNYHPFKRDEWDAPTEFTVKFE